MAGLPGLPPPGFASKPTASGLPGLPAPGFAEASVRGGQSDLAQTLIGKDATNLQKFGRGVVGGLATTIPFLDRLIAGGVSTVDDIGSYLQGADVNPADSYERRLAEVRRYEDAFQEAISPSTTADVAHKVIPAVLMPFKSKVPARSSVFGKVATGTAETSALSGLLGVSQGRTPEEMAQKGWEGLETGAKWGFGLTAVPAAVGAAIARKAPQIKEAGQASLRKSVGFRSTDANRTAEEIGVWDIIDDAVETPMKKTLDEMFEAGKLDTAKAGKLVATAARTERKLATEIDDVIRAYDDLGAAAPAPSFDDALNYIAKKVPADEVPKYLDDLDNFADSLKREGDGTLAYLQEQKITQGTRYKPGENILNGFNRALYHDLQKTIEKSAPGVKPLNRELAKWKLIRPVLNRNLSGDEASDIAGTAIQKLRTSGGNTVGPILAGGAIGGQFGGAAGGALGLLAGAAATPGGRQATGKALIGLSESGPAISVAAGRIPKAIAAASLGIESSQANRQRTKLGLPTAARQGSRTRYFDQPLEGRSTQQSAGGKQAKSGLPYPLKPPANIFEKPVSNKHIPAVVESLKPAVRQVESGGGKYLKGPKLPEGDHALGPFQFRKATADMVNKKHGTNHDLMTEKGSAALFELYMTDLLERYDGNVRKALAAYGGAVSPHKVDEYVGKIRNVFEKA